MKDFNFFDPYIDKDFKISKQFILYFVLLLSLISLAGYGILNKIKINKLVAESNEKRILAEDPSIVEKVNNIKIQEDELMIFKEEVASIRELNHYIEETNVISTDFLSSITSKMPEDLFLTSFNISNAGVDLAGISQDKLAVAQFKKGLENIEKFDDIFVSNITREEDYYQFNINILLEEVDLDGDDIIEEESDETTN